MTENIKSTFYQNAFTMNWEDQNSMTDNKKEKEKQYINSLPKPDLSPLTQKDMKFSLKCHGSYKKPKRTFPESPMKSPVQKYFTPIKIEGKNLFGTAPQKDLAFRKLNFDVALDEENFKGKRKFSNFLDHVDEKDEDTLLSPEHSSEQKNEKISLSNMIELDHVLVNNNKSINPFIGNVNSKSEVQINVNENKNHKMEKDFVILKTLSQNKFDAVYKCKNIKTNKIYAIKKSYKNSCKNNISTVKELYNDLNSNISSPYEQFCNKYLEYWIEEEIYDIIESSTHFTDKNLYILTEFYENGDLLDYLSKLEQSNYSFTSNFYWDIIFEMLVGVLFFHECGYLHLDIKPANFLVNDEGYIKLSDFGLSQKMKKLQEIDDIFEGDSTYISPEVFNRNSVHELNQKCDVYSLGLSILEILAKVELPKNGPLWRAMRSYEMYSIPNEFLVNWNIQNQEPFWNLIKIMIAPLKERMDIISILTSNQFPELNQRYKLLLHKQYVKTVKIPSFPKSNHNLLNVLKPNNEIAKSPKNIKKI